MKIFGGNNRKKKPVGDETAPIPAQAGQAKGNKNGGASKPMPTMQPAKPGGKKVSKRLKPQTIALIVLAVILVLAGSVYGFVKVFAKPPDVSPDAKPPVAGKEDGEDDPFADLVEPFIEEGDKERKKDYYTFMLCGTDDGGTRTDTIIVASYDVNTQKVNMVNIPRDTMSNVKRKIKKINSGFNGGPEQLEKELEMLLGIPIDRYVVVSFEGFEELIDLIGGVDFEVPNYMVWDDPTQDLHIYLEPGMQHLDGEKAIQLVRFRQNNPGVKGGYAEGDIGRIKMQQEFLRTIAKKLLSASNIPKIGSLASAVIDHTETNLTLSELTWFGMKALSMRSDSISMSTLPGHAAYLYEPDYGHMQSYFVPEQEPILETVNELLNPYTEKVTKLNLIDVSKYSGTAPAGSGSSSKGGKDDDDPTGGSPSDGSSSGNSPSSGSGSNGNSSNGNSSGGKPDGDQPDDTNQPDEPGTEQPGGDAPTNGNPPEEGGNGDGTGEGGNAQTGEGQQGNEPTEPTEPAQPTEPSGGDGAPSGDPQNTDNP